MSSEKSCPSRDHSLSTFAKKCYFFKRFCERTKWTIPYKEKPLQLAEAQKILYFYESFNKHKTYNLIDRMLCEQKYSQNYSFRNFVGIL